jgi:ATP-dependent exoDNAse (exonuclease V) alpha subunit
MYKTKLAEILRELHFNTISDEQSFKIHSIPKSICEHFSKRKKQILGAMEARGIYTARAANLAAKMTRSKKQAIDRPKLFKTWQSEMDERGFTEEKFQELQQKSHGIHLPDESDLTTVNFSHQYLSEILTESVSIFSEVDVYNAALSTAMRLAMPATAALKLAETFLKSQHVIELQTHMKQERQFTTHQMRELEHELVRNAQALHNKPFISGLSETDITIAQTRIGLELSEEQQEAILGVLGDACLEIVSGSAGAGKSTVMKLVADIYLSKGASVWGASIAKAAANNLEQETGVPSSTISKLLLDLERKYSKVKGGDVVIIDEAGQVGVKQMQALQEHAVELGFKIVLTGDAKQLAAIEHAGVLSYFSRTEVLGTTRIETIRRQRQEWDRKAVANFRDGLSGQALDKYKEHKRLHFLKDEESTYSKIVNDLNNFREKNPLKKSMVLARTWSDVLPLNALIRARLQEKGEIETQDFSINGRVGSREINFLLSVNDRIRFTRNNPQLGFTNGDIGTVSRMKRNSFDELIIKIERDDGRSVIVKKSIYSDEKDNLFIVPAYAQTIYSAQGQTVDGDVFVLHDPMLDRANAYVALSRHKDDCHLYVALDTVIENDAEVPPDKTIEDIAIDKIASQYSKEKRSKLSIEYEPIERKDMEVSRTHSEIEIESEFAVS